MSTVYSYSTERVENDACASARSPNLLSPRVSTFDLLHPSCFSAMGIGLLAVIYVARFG